MGQCSARPSQLALLQRDGMKSFYFHDFSPGLTLGDNVLNFIFLFHVIRRETRTACGVTAVVRTGRPLGGELTQNLQFLLNDPS